MKTCLASYIGNYVYLNWDVDRNLEQTIESWNFKLTKLINWLPLEYKNDKL